MIEIRFDKTKDEVALLIWFLVDHSVLVRHKILYIMYHGHYLISIPSGDFKSVT
jgi:hypothetical protein